MRVWVDLTNSPHVLVMRPLIEAMRADGHKVEVTAHDFAQTLELCERFGIVHEGRLRRLTDPADVSLERRSEHGGLRIRRYPRELVRLLLSAADS
jgi:predicted glycosyltransferase